MFKGGTVTGVREAGIAGIRKPGGTDTRGSAGRSGTSVGTNLAIIPGGNLEPYLLI